MRFINRFGRECDIVVIDHEVDGALHVVTARFPDNSVSTLTGFDRDGYIAVTPHMCADAELDCKLIDA